MRLKLRITPIPASTWGVSLANKLPYAQWAELRQRVYRNADYKCQICGCTTRTLHAHEVWIWDDRKRIQHLAGIECCCDLCHDVHHFGRTSVTKPKAYQEECIKHWCQVNRKTRRDFNIYLQEIKAINYKRANKQYLVKVGRRILY